MQAEQAQDWHLQRQVWVAGGGGVALRGSWRALLRQGQGWARPKTREQETLEQVAVEALQGRCYNMVMWQRRRQCQELLEEVQIW